MKESALLTLDDVNVDLPVDVNNDIAIDSDVENNSVLGIDFIIEEYAGSTSFTDDELRTIIPDNDFEKLLQRHFELVEYNTSFHKYTRHLLDLILYYNETIDACAIKTMPIPVKLNDLFNKDKYKLSVSRGNVNKYAVNIQFDLYGVKSVTPVLCHCGSSNFYYDGYRIMPKNTKSKTDKKLRCLSCCQYTYIKTFLGRIINERKMIIAIKLVEVCS